MRSPLAGLTAKDPVKTPVFSRSSAWRARSVLAAAAARYAATAAAGVGWRPVHSGRVRSGQAGAVSASTIGCSGASTMNVAPNSVSALVVNTSMGPAPEVNATVAPWERPIQLRCIVLIDSGQSSRSRSSMRRSA